MMGPVNEKNYIKDGNGGLKVFKRFGMKYFAMGGVLKFTFEISFFFIITSHGSQISSNKNLLNHTNLERLTPHAARE